jgi:hypothetical protein
MLMARLLFAADEMEEEDLAELVRIAERKARIRSRDAEGNFQAVGLPEVRVTNVPQSPRHLFPLRGGAYQGTALHPVFCEGKT